MPDRILRTRAPDSLSARDWTRLHDWCVAKFPWFERELTKLAEGCLEYHGGKGTLALDWAKVCMTWVRNQDRWQPEIRNGWKRREREREAQAKREAELLAAQAERNPQLPLGLSLERSFRRGHGPLSGDVHALLSELGKGKG